MRKRKEKFNRSRMMINEFIVNLCTKHYCSDGSIMPDINKEKYGFVGAYPLGGGEPPVGALCRIIAAPPTKYYLSWYLGKKDGYYYLQSIEDHEVCQWSNIRLEYIPIELTKDRPYFKYSDRQFKFNDLWGKIVDAHNYWMVPMWTEFNDKTGEVTLTIRWKYEKTRISRKFPSWEDVTVDEMKAFAEEAEKEHGKKN